MKYFKIHNAYKKTFHQYTSMESETNQVCIDQCSVDWDNLENITDSELDEKYEENSSWDYWGYGPTDSHYEINGPITVTDVTSEYQTV